MENMKLNKSIILVHNLLRIMRVFCVVGAVLVVILAIAFPSLWNIMMAVIENPSYASDVDAALLTELDAMGGLVPYMLSVFAVAAISLVIEFLILKIAVDVLGEMREGVIFAVHYGPQLRKACKLIVIQVIGAFVLSLVCAVMFLPGISPDISSYISINLSGLMIAAFVNCVSYLLDYGYSRTQKNEYIEQENSEIV